MFTFSQKNIFEYFEKIKGIKSIEIVIGSNGKLTINLSVDTLIYMINKKSIHYKILKFKCFTTVGTILITNIITEDGKKYEIRED